MNIPSRVNGEPQPVEEKRSSLLSELPLTAVFAKTDTGAGFWGEKEVRHDPP